MNLIKTFTNSENKITHVEIALSHTEDEITTTVSDIFELREAVEEPITEEQAIKSIAVWASQVQALQKALRTKISLASHTETVL